MKRNDKNDQKWHKQCLKWLKWLNNTSEKTQKDYEEIRTSFRVMKMTRTVFENKSGDQYTKDSV